MKLYYTVEELARTLEAIRKRLRGGEIQGVRVGRPRGEAVRLLGSEEAFDRTKEARA